MKRRKKEPSREKEEDRETLFIHPPEVPYYEIEEEGLRGEAHSRPAFRTSETNTYGKYRPQSSHAEEEEYDNPPYRYIAGGYQGKEPRHEETYEETETPRKKPRARKKPSRKKAA